MLKPRTQKLEKSVPRWRGGAEGASEAEASARDGVSLRQLKLQAARRTIQPRVVPLWLKQSAPREC